MVNLAFEDYADHFRYAAQDLFCRYPARKTHLRWQWLRRLFFEINRGTLKLFRIANFSKSRFHAVVVADLPKFQFGSGLFFCLGDPEFDRTVKQKKIVLLFGRFFRDFDNLVKYEETIRSYFSLNNAIQANVDKFLRDARESVDVVVGIHLRRGDYRYYKNGRFFFEQWEYEKVMDQIKNCERQKRIRFILCSNETIDDRIFLNHDFVKGPGHVVEDMYILAGCDYILGPPSSYSRWASFYGKVPIYSLEQMDGPTIGLKSFKIMEPATLLDF